MSISNPAPEMPAETFQEGMQPVQEFTSRAIPVLPGAALAPRRGRPARSQEGKKGKIAQPAPAVKGGQLGAVLEAKIGHVIAGQESSIKPTQ
jgi:hypothetical protein